MSKMSKLFSRLKKKTKFFPIEKVNEKWKFRFCVWKKTTNIFPMKMSVKYENFACEFGKTSKMFPMKKPQKWHSRLWVCPWGICDFLDVQLFFEVPWDFWETSIFFRKESRYQRFYPIPTCGVCEHLCRCIPPVCTRPLGYKNLYSNRVYFAVFEDTLKYKIIVDYLGTQKE